MENTKKFAAEMYSSLNGYRLANGLTTCKANPQLEQAASIEAKWNAYALKKRLIGYPTHTTSAAWAKAKYPNLLWPRLIQIYGFIPEWLSIFDLAIICGYGTIAGSTSVSDIGGLFSPNPSPEECLAGWDRSPGHKAIILISIWREFGVAEEPASGGSVAYVAWGQP